MSRSTRATPRIRLLGIDPGTRLAGWGVVEVGGGEARLVACGCLRTRPGQPLAQRLVRIFAGYRGVIAKYRPAAAALEETFAGKNPKSAIAMGQGRGVALLALAQADLPIAEVSPAAIKQAVTGKGNATKALVARMVCARLRLARAPEPADVPFQLVHGIKGFLLDETLGQA
jgi:crossover junction endodeoxyribonuclease RuvC